ncbi:MAG: AAA family ATPase [Caldilineaceae bacterium]|nr:AAA family ATPase [Caldilineaceae bacterium]
MYLSELVIRNFRLFGEGETEFHLRFQPGVTVLVGRNDAGKSAIIDAIRYTLLTREQEYVRVDQEDFHIDDDGNQASSIYIECTFSELSDDERAAFLELLSYVDGNVTLYVTWTARRLSELPGTRRWVDVSVRSGRGGVGPPLETSTRVLLATAYLRPLRDAEREMSSGRRSRLSQILSNVPEISSGDKFDDTNVPPDAATVERLGLVGIAEYMRHSIRRHSGVRSSERAINDQYLGLLSLHGDLLRGKIDVTAGGTDDARLRQILELLELCLVSDLTGSPRGRYGLGSNNLLFIACELLLLGRSAEGVPLLLIEEPEAHLHPQRQIRLMDLLFKASRREVDEVGSEVQIVVSTHSPNLASKVPVRNFGTDRGWKSVFFG